MSDKLHAIASPSKAAMWLTCANSLAANEGQPEGDRKAADLGTDKHTLLTDCLSFDVNADSYSGRPMPFGHAVDKGFADDVQTVVDNVRERIRGYVLRGCAVSVELEQAVPIDHITGESDGTGTADVVLLVTWPDGRATLDVIDAKFGYQEVLADENPQLMMYGAGALEKFGIVEDFSEVTLVIEQPLRGSTEWTTTPAVINEWVETRASPAAHKALMLRNMAGERALKMEDFTVSEKGCMWCKAKAVCPALRAKVEAITECDFDSVEPTDTATIPVDRLGEIFGELELVEDWIKGVRARVELELMAGRQIPGLKVVAGKRGNRAWASDDEAEALMKKFKMKQEVMYSFKLLGPKPILEALKDHPRRLKQIEALIIQPAGKPHVALESDKRPALEIKPLEDGFEAVDDLC